MKGQVVTSAPHEQVHFLVLLYCDYQSKEVALKNFILSTSLLLWFLLVQVAFSPLICDSVGHYVSCSVGQSIISLLFKLLFVYSSLF